MGYERSAEPAGVSPYHCCPDREAITGRRAEQTGLCEMKRQSPVTRKASFSPRVPENDALTCRSSYIRHIDFEN